jgi:uncharacterized membrane protein YbhN (UPF0104 family)
MSVRAPSPSRLTRRRAADPRRGGCPERDEVGPSPAEDEVRPAESDEVRPAESDELRPAEDGVRPTESDEILPAERDESLPSPAESDEVDPGAPEAAPARAGIGRRVATVALLVALGISLLLSVPGLRPVVTTIEAINPAWVALAIALELASCISFVIVFRLFFDRVRGRDARALAWTSMASGALLPGGGVGGYAIGGWLVYLTGAPTRWIVRRSSGLFFFTTGINSIAVITSGVLLVAGVSGPHNFTLAALPVILAGGATIVILALPVIARRRGAGGRLEALIVGISDAWRVLLRPSWRLLGAIGYLGFDIAVLWVAFSAIGEPPSVPALVLGYTIGYLGNSVPVPGGIGVLDAGLAGALLLYGAAPGHVVAAVLVYHAIAFWIPSLGGVIAYARLRPRLTAHAGAGSGNADARAPASPPAAG